MSRKLDDFSTQELVDEMQKRSFEDLDQNLKEMLKGSRKELKKFMKPIRTFINEILGEE